MTKLFMKVTPEVGKIVPYIVRDYGVSFRPMAINMFAAAYLQSVSKATAAIIAMRYLIPELHGVQRRNQKS